MNIVTIFKKALHDVPTRLQRMIMKLQAYDLDVVHKPGKQMFIPDTLPRTPVKEPDTTSNLVD